MIKKNIEKILLSFIILSLITIFISSICISYYKIGINTYSYILYTIGIISLILVILYKIFNKEKLKLIELVLIIISLLGLLSTFLAHDINISLFGFYGRNEGLFTLLTYYIIFILSTYIKNDKYKKIIIYVILSIGIINIIYGFFQVTDIINEPIIMGKHAHARGFIGNANSFGAFCLVNVFLSFGLYLLEHKKICLIPSIIFLFGIYISGTMSSLLTVVLVFIALFIYLFIKNKNSRKKYIIKCLIFILISLICLGLVQSFSKKNYIIQIKNMGEQILDVAQGKIEDSYGSDRIYIWKNTLKEYPKFIIHGIGIDNFFYVSDPPLILPKTHQMIDKAHNEYLQILVTEGIFTLITYIIFLILLIMNSIKNNSKISKVILLAIIAYLFQAFFNISITRLTPIIFILMGLMYERKLKY